MNYTRAWDGDAWQRYALRLVQLRHLPHNVQIVPDRVKGDAGIEFFSTDGCLYQCYAPEEVVDVAKAASAMKAKGARDLNKLVANQTTIASILQNIMARRWILLCPFLDDKSVVAFVRHKGSVLGSNGPSFVDSTFEALVQSQDDFQTEIERLAMQSLPTLITIDDARAQPVDADSDIMRTVLEKLGRAFPSAPESEISQQASGNIAAYAIRENILQKMRADYPVLWERSVRSLEAEERRLVALGIGSGAPGQRLSDSVSRIETSLKNDLPSLSQSIITDIAVGTLSDWLIRCPLDFVGNRT